MEDRWIDLEKLLETINIKKDLEIDELDWNTVYDRKLWCNLTHLVFVVVLFIIHSSFTILVMIWLELVDFVDNIAVTRWCRSEQWFMGWGDRMYEG